jgi:hypothetical protein
MRLGQLSRKLGIGTSEIINFLASKNISIGEDSNAKIEDEHAHWITQHYAPHLLVAVDASISEEKVESAISMDSTISSDIPVAITETSLVTSIQELVQTDEPTLPEIIKAPKIELSGLKVLGKIELPEKKKKEAANSEQGEDATGNETNETPFVKQKQQPKKEWAERPQKNPIALQRERAEREAERKRKEKLLREKEKKTYAYLSKVKTQAPIKKSRVVEEQLEHAIAIEEQPKTLWGKFKKWVRT